MILAPEMLFAVTVLKFKWKKLIKVNYYNQKIIVTLSKLHLTAHNIQTHFFFRTVKVYTIILSRLDVKVWDILHINIKRFIKFVKRYFDSWLWRNGLADLNQKLILNQYLSIGFWKFKIGRSWDKMWKKNYFSAKFIKKRLYRWLWKSNQHEALSSYNKWFLNF